MNDIDELQIMSEHTDTLIQGALDTIDGNERYGLTYAQRYLKGVMWANGDISAEVHGNESVLSGIKNWVSKAIEAIKTAFKAVWDWIFGSKSSGKSLKEKAETAVEATEAAEEKITTFTKAAEHPPKPKPGKDSVSDALAVEYKKTATKVAEEDPALAKELTEAATELKNQDDEKPIPKASLIINTVLKKRMEKRAKEVDAATDKRLTELKDRTKGLKYAGWMRGELENLVSRSDLARHIRGIDSISQCTTVTRYIRNTLIEREFQHGIERLEDYRSKIDGFIKEYEDLVSGKEENFDGKDNTVLKETLKTYRVLADVIKDWAVIFSTQLKLCEEIANNLPVMFSFPDQMKW